MALAAGTGEEGSVKAADGRRAAVGAGAESLYRFRPAEPKSRMKRTWQRNSIKTKKNTAEALKGIGWNIKS
jgi:hypothetical protein